MKYLPALFSFLTLPLFATPSFAADIKVAVTSYSLSCGYFSNQVEKVMVTYTNAQLPAGTKVQLHWGLGGTKPESDGTQDILNWSNGSWRGEDAQTKNYDPYMNEQQTGIYTITLTFSTHSRSEAAWYTQFQFVLKQEQASGIFWDKPGIASGSGYYQASIAERGSCTDQNHPIPPLHDVAVQSVL